MHKKIAGKAVALWPSPVLARKFLLSADESSQPSGTRGLQVRILSGTVFFIYKSNKISTFCALHSVNTRYPKG